MIGDYSSVNSAAWIYKKSCNEHIPTDDSGIVMLYYWTRFAIKHPMYDGDTYISAEYLMNIGSTKYPNASNNPVWKGLIKLKDDKESQVDFDPDGLYE